MRTTSRIHIGLMIVVMVGGLLLAPAASARAVDSGGLMGTVDVQPGADARVLVRNLDSGTMATATPAQNGNYRLERLAAGSYEVMLIVDGKSVAHQLVRVEPGFSVTVPELYPGG